MAKVCLITGTRKGIGLFLAERFLAQGFTVIGCSRRQGTLEAAGYEHFECDVSDEQAVTKMVRSIVKKHGQIDILINNAGIAAMNHSLVTPGKTVDRVFKTNVYGSFFLMREVAKAMMRKKTGRIINFTTVAVPFSLEGEAVYAASKSAVETLTKVCAREFAPYGINVNAVGPTPIKTDLIAGVPSDKIDELINRQPIQRYGEYEDVANVIDFYVRPESSFITGQILYLGGVS